MSTLTSAFSEAAKQYRDRIALIDGNGTAYRFSEVQGVAEAYAAGWFARGVRPGDRVLIAMGIGVDLYASLAALWSLGATVVLPEPAMGLAGVRHAVTATEPKFFCGAGTYKWVKWLIPGLWSAKALSPAQRSNAAVKLAEEDPDRTALISFTSGTTGTPKAIARSHAFLMAQWAAVGPLLESDADEIDLVTFPVFVLINLAVGRTSVLPNWKMSKLGELAPKDLVDWIETTSCTRALLPPALCEKIVEADSSGSLTHIFTGGGPVFPDVIRGLRALNHLLEITTVYGSTEAEPIAHAHGETEDGYGLLVGHTVDAVQLRIVDDEIQVSGDHVNKGYLDPARDAETKAREGDTIWHRTGDAGRLDEQGRLWLLGSVGEQVTTDQGLLYPFAIEATSRLWPGVRRTALLSHHDGPVLVIEGSSSNRSEWTQRAVEFGIHRVIPIDKIPLDKRHQSKVDRKALRGLLQKKLG